MSSPGSCVGSPSSDTLCDTNASPMPSAIRHELDSPFSNSSLTARYRSRTFPLTGPWIGQMADVLSPVWNSRLMGRASDYFTCPSPGEDYGLAKSGRITPTIEAEGPLHFADVIPADYCLPTPPPISEAPHLSLFPLGRPIGAPSSYSEDIHRPQPMPCFQGLVDGVDVNGANGTVSGGLSTGIPPETRHISEPRSLKETSCTFLRSQDSGYLSHSSPMATSPHDGLGSPWSYGPVPSNLAEKRLGVRFSLSMEPLDAAGDGGGSAALCTSPVPDLLQDDEDNDSWLDAAVQVVKSALSSQTTRSSLKVLSHALPLPSVPGHSFPRVIEKSTSQLPSDEIMWTSLLHAVPGQFKLEDLPKSPLTTPGQPLSGDDYFATKIFESAVTSVDYNEGITLSSPRSHPLAAPGSVDMAIVERHIPPPTSDELYSLYNPTGRSILVDRLVELSPQNGCLLFVYPTRKGGQTFATEYLGPVLDPLLRSIAVLHNFSANLSNSLGRMASIDNLVDFEHMHENVSHLCNMMSKDVHDIKRRLHGIGGTFELIYADKKEVSLERAVWSDWWTKQEKGRIRSVATDYFSTCASHGMMTHTLIREVLDGVSSRQTQNQPTEKIELGVFVIKRTAK